MKVQLISDRAENSIMQTISIAVSAILIAAGLVTAPSLINNARDANVMNDLASVAYAQDYHLADKGSYSDVLADLSGPNFKITTASDSLGIKKGADCFAVFARSDSGSYFYRTSSSTKAQKVPKPWPASKPSGYPANCDWPSAAGGSVVSPELSALLASANMRVTDVTGIADVAAAGNFNLATGYTMAAAFVTTDANVANNITVMGAEARFKLQLSGSRIAVLSGTGSGWNGTTYSLDGAKRDGSLNWAIATARPNGTDLVTAAGKSSTTYQATTFSGVTANGFQSGRESVGSTGRILYALAWDRQLTASETTLLSGFLAGLR